MVKLGPLRIKIINQIRGEISKVETQLTCLREALDDTDANDPHGHGLALEAVRSLVNKLTRLRKELSFWEINDEV